MHVDVTPKAGDEAIIALHTERRDQALAALAALGWRRIEQDPGEASPQSAPKAAATAAPRP